MFSRWGAFVYRFRRPVALIAVVIAIASTVLAAQASSALSSGGWLDADSESAAVSARLDSEFGAGKSSIIALFRSATPGADAASAEFQAAIKTATAGLATTPHVTGIVGYAETGDRRFISTAGDAAYIVVLLDTTDEASVESVDDVRAGIVPPGGFTYELTGYGPVTKDSAEQSEKDLQKAELVSLPIVAIVLVLVFASLVAASMPLLVAGLAIPSSLALIYLVAQQVEMSIFVLNIATMLGLALAIDYSLFIVSRFREELRRGRSVGDAVERSVATAGKAVAFSGIAVAIGLAGLVVFKAPAIQSIGLAGSIVVLCSVVFALTFLPAVLGMLGHRVNALSIGGLRHRFRPVADGVEVARTSRWERVAHAVMRRPIAVLVPTLAFLLILGLPFLRLQQGVPGAEIYPAGVESRDAYVALQTEFAPGETTPIVILADVTGAPTDPANIKTLTDYAATIAAIDGIDRVEGPFTIHDPSTGTLLTPEQVAALYALPADQRPPGLDALLAQYVRGSTVRLDAISPLSPSRPEATNLIPIVRATPAGSGITTQVGGSAAIGQDFLISQAERAPYAIGLTLFASGLILFLLFGSVVIPLKAIIMTLLSITASFGAMVWIFQQGNLSDDPRLHAARLHHRGQPDHHVQCPVRPVDGLRGPAPVPDPGGLPADRRQHGVGRRGPGQDRRGHHRSGPDHGLGLRGVLAGRHHHDQEHRGRDGHRRADRRDHRPRPAGAGDHAPDGQVELVGPRLPGPVRRPARVQPRRGRRGRGGDAEPGDRTGPGRLSGGARPASPGPGGIVDTMRLILDAEIRPETVARLRALSPDLEVVDVTGDPAFDARTVADPEVEVIIGSRPPTDLAGVPRLRWLQVRSAGVDHLAADPPWRKGLLVTNAKGVYAVPIGEYVSGMVLRVHQPAATWGRDQAAHHWPADEPPMITIIRGRTAVIAGYGSLGREVARQLSALGMRIVAVKPRPEVRTTPRSGCRAPATPTDRSPIGSSATASWARWSARPMSWS